MFNKERFAKILKQIISEYNSISEFAEISSVDRTYLSKCINLQLDGPPSPNMLRKIANATSKYTYIDLMYVCGYINDNEYGDFKNRRSNVSNYELDNPMNLNFIQYVRLNETGREKVNDYIIDLTDTHKYKRKNKNN